MHFYGIKTLCGTLLGPAPLMQAGYGARWTAIAREHGVEVDTEENGVLTTVLRVLGRDG